MQSKFIDLILLAFLTTGAVAAQAATPASAPEKATTNANLSDDALASYITGRLTPLLKDTGYQVTQTCDSTGCAVVVQ